MIEKTGGYDEREWKGGRYFLVNTLPSIVFYDPPVCGLV